MKKSYFLIVLYISSTLAYDVDFQDKIHYEDSKRRKKANNPDIDMNVNNNNFTALRKIVFSELDFNSFKISVKETFTNHDPKTSETKQPTTKSILTKNKFIVSIPETNIVIIKIKEKKINIIPIKPIIGLKI